MINPYPISIIQLDDRPIPMTLTQTVAQLSAPLNLTGATIVAEVRDVELNLVAALTVQVVSAIAGTVLISLPSGGMSKSGKFVWDASITIAGVERYLPMSTFTVARSATRVLATG